MTYEIILGISIGFIAWFVTGIDDFFIVLLYMKMRRGILNILAVSIGTTAAVFIMMAICGFADISVENLLSFSPSFKYGGLIPISLGLYGLIKNIILKDNPNSPTVSEKKKNYWGMGIAAGLTYLTNSLDDIIVNTGILQGPGFNQGSILWFCFFIGILLGSTTNCFIAYFVIRISDNIAERWSDNLTLKISTRVIPIVVNLCVIGIGIGILTNLFGTN